MKVEEGIKMKKKKAMGIILLILLLLLLFPYLKVEVLTGIYGNQFESLYNASGWLNQLSYFKVMKYNGDKADVYYADLDGISGATFLYHFEKESGEWELKNWECIWSKSGSADKFIWPYYFH